MNASDARGLIAVDKMGGKVLFLDPVSYETIKILDDFERVPHELLVVRELSIACIPIYGDGIHGRNLFQSRIRSRGCGLDPTERLDKFALKPQTANGKIFYGALRLRSKKANAIGSANTVVSASALGSLSEPR